MVACFFCLFVLLIARLYVCLFVVVWFWFVVIRWLVSFVVVCGLLLFVDVCWLWIVDYLFVVACSLLIVVVCC